MIINRYFYRHLNVLKYRYIYLNSLLTHKNWLLHKVGLEVISLSLPYSSRRLRHQMYLTLSTLIDYRWTYAIYKIPRTFTHTHTHTKTCTWMSLCEYVCVWMYENFINTLSLSTVYPSAQRLFVLWFFMITIYDHSLFVT